MVPPVNTTTATKRNNADNIRRFFLLNNNKYNNFITTILPFIVCSFIAGSLVSTIFVANKIPHDYDDPLFLRKRREHGGASIEGNDLSLYFGSNKKELTTITKDQTFLPNEFYEKLVLDTVIVCVDIMLVRYNTSKKRKEVLLVERASEPVKGVYWFPGGRMYKGETFFTCAQRQAKEETGVKTKPVQVLGVYNTFFPTSHWDNAKQKGTQTVDIIVLIELLELEQQHVKLDETSNKYRWIGLNPNDALHESTYVQQGLLSLQAWDPNYYNEKRIQ